MTEQDLIRGKRHPASSKRSPIVISWLVLPELARNSIPNGIWVSSSLGLISLEYQLSVLMAEEVGRFQDNDK